MSGKTKEERYLLHLYATALKGGDAQHPCHQVHIGQLMGLSPKAVKGICHTLLRANFIKKLNEEEIYLTEQGIELVKTLTK